MLGCDGCELLCSASFGLLRLALAAQPWRRYADHWRDVGGWGKRHVATGNSKWSQHPFDHLAVLNPVTHKPVSVVVGEIGTIDFDQPDSICRQYVTAALIVETTLLTAMEPLSVRRFGLSK